MTSGELPRSCTVTVLIGAAALCSCSRGSVQESVADGGVADGGLVCESNEVRDGGEPDGGGGRPSYCADAGPDTLQYIEGTPASPYLVHHPATDNPGRATVVFLPGGSGSSTSAQRIWERFVSRDRRVKEYRVVIPYSYAEDFIDDARRTFQIVDEVLTCYGGDPAKVHLAGYSNGGRAAFGLMLAKPDRFATLLGAPGVLPTTDRATLAKALACRGRAVFNGVGELDEGWKALVRESHQALLDAGVDSVYVEFPGETHRVSDAFTGGVFYDFWAKH